MISGAKVAGVVELEALGGGGMMEEKSLLRGETPSSLDEDFSSCYDAPCIFLEGVEDQGGGWLYTGFLDDPGPQEENGRWPSSSLWHER